MEQNTPKTPKEIDVFNRFSKFNKLKVTLIALGIALVISVVTYCFAKSLMPYFITIETYGGLVYGEELEVATYHFWQRSVEPKGLKKEGYYIEGYYKDKAMTDRYEFGSSIWHSLKLYVNWQPGYAVKLNFAEGEEEWADNITIDYIKTYYEQYVKPGSKYTLHKIYNDIPYVTGANHENEQLLWFENEECTGDPFDIKTYTVDRNINLYGKWFDTDESKFDIDDNGTLNRYLGKCKRIILPDSVRKIKDIDYTKFQTGTSDQLYEKDGKYYSAFQNVLNDLEIIYINANCVELGDCSFKDCVKLDKVYFLGEGCCIIGNRAFDHCKALTTITLPSSVETIEDRAFGHTTALSTIGGCTGVKTIGAEGFLDSGIESLELYNVTRMGKETFSGCTKLKTLILRGNSVVDASDVTTSSGDVNNNVLYLALSAKVYVLENLVNSYKSTYPWNAYEGRIFSIDELTN